MIVKNDTYDPGLFFKNRHFNTVFRHLWIKAGKEYERKRLNTPDGDFIDLDLRINGNQKMVLLIHGLEGSSDSEYIKTVAAYLSQNGYDIAAINQRGCSGTPNSVLQSYHSGKTDDLELALNYLSENFDYTRFFAVGYSLGGNQLLKFLGEKGTSARNFLQGAVSVSVPVDLEGAAKALSKSSNRIYMKAFLDQLIPKALDKAARFPDAGLDEDAIRNCKDFYDFDNAVTAPSFGFKNARDYWNKSSSKAFLPEIKLPVLLLNAQDDPFLDPSCYPDKETRSHRYIHFYKPRYGGHVGFNKSFIPQKNNWLEAQILQFLQKTQ